MSKKGPIALFSRANMPELWKYDHGVWVYVEPWTGQTELCPGCNYRVKADGKWILALHRLSD